MPSRILDRFAAEAPYGPWFWAMLVTMMTGLLIAFWSLCAHQVAQAELRHEVQQVERVALVECLQRFPQSTFSSCASQVAPRRVPQVLPRDLLAESEASVRAGAGGAVPVNFNYR